MLQVLFLLLFLFVRLFCFFWSSLFFLHKVNKHNGKHETTQRIRVKIDFGNKSCLRRISLTFFPFAFVFS